MPHDHHHGNDHTEPPSDLELRVKALESLLIEKGLVNSDALDTIVIWRHTLYNSKTTIDCYHRHRHSKNYFAGD